MNRGLAYAIGIILVIVVAIVAYKAFVPSISAPATAVTPPVANSTVIVQLTDPPAVPSGTQALMLYYSNVELHAAGKSNSNGFVSLNDSGSVNLMNLTNITQTIGVGKVNKSSNFDLLRLNVSSATITIDNVTYNVSVPNNRLLVRLSSLMNATSPTALLDFYPSVLQIYAANQTIFVLVPSLKGIVIKGLPLNSTQAHIGAKARIENSAKAEIERLTPNITITQSKLSVHNTNVDFSVTVRDNSNRSVVVKGIMLSGYMRRLGPIAMPIVKKVPTSVDAGSSGFGSMPGGFGLGSLGSILGGLNLSSINLTNISSIASRLGNVLSTHGINISKINVFGLGNLSNITIKKLGSILRSGMNASVFEDIRDINVSNASVEAILHQVGNFSRDYHNVLNFVVLGNGTLSLPFDRAEFEDGQVNGQNGYNLSAGSSETFSFNGTIRFGTSPIVILPLVNQTYSIRVVGERGARASTNVTAS